MTTNPIKLLTIGDLHYAGIGPKAYLPNSAAYKQDQLNIMAECAELAFDNHCNAVLLPGDITHSHVMSLPVLHELVEALKRFPCPVLTVAGNHDRETSNLDDLKAAPYGVIRAAGVIKDLNIRSHMVCINGVTFLLSGVAYTEKTDLEVDQYLRTPVEADIHIHISHGLLLPDHPWYITDKANKIDDKGNKHRYTTFDELRQIPEQHRPNILINGHYHDGHPATWLDDKTLIVNFGAVCRLSRSVGEINRTLQVGLITINSPDNYKAEPTTLKSQRPGHECLNREELVRELERNKQKDKMAEYLELLGTKRETRTRDAREEIRIAVRELGEKGMELPGGIAERCVGGVDAVAGRMTVEEEGMGAGE
jgi:DNA repair exonuclease SbcCD nuclease subunit